MNGRSNEQMGNAILSPGDKFQAPIAGARRLMTRTVALTGVGTKDAIEIPYGTYEVTISADSKVTYYETAATYVEDGITYGSGVSGTLMVIPVYDRSLIYVEGTGNVSLCFANIKER